MAGFKYVRVFWKSDLMVEDLKEFEKLINEKNISDVDTMMEESKRLVKDKIPDFEKKYNEVIQKRGIVIDASITLETAFDELITKTGGEDLVMNPEKKEFHLITGLRGKDELGGLGFKQKVSLVKGILRKNEEEAVYRDYIQSEKWKEKNNQFVSHFKKCAKCDGIENLSSFHISLENFGEEEISDVEVLCWLCQMRRKPIKIELLKMPDPPLLADLEKIVTIRDIFAHVAINWLSNNLEFNDTTPYTKHFFKFNPNWKNVNVAFKEFMDLQKEMLELIPVYIKGVLLKREIFSQFLLGKPYSEILDDFEKLKGMP
ncbi:MAG: hypothetical protein Q7S33_04465 [Nanoarchaeota archaeon]|nr:hypothetical protein [Nanoarchaeota archaeon]